MLLSFRVFKSCILLILIAISTIAFSQDTTSINATPKLAQKGLLGDFVININADTSGLKMLDSIILALDSFVNQLEPSPTIYGHGMFDVDSLQIFQPGAVVKVPDSYVLSTGDEVGITIFGTSQFDAKLVVDEGGFIQPSKMPRILLKGLTWRQVKQLLQRRFRNYYVFRPAQMAVVLTKPRLITVNIFGEVKRPGSYTMVATNTAFNAIAAAGGPTKTGSVRRIKITNGSDQKELDLYEVMMNPITQFDYYLDDNVFIQIPSAEHIVSVTGAIHRPLRYELKKGEGLTDLINYAGGLAPGAVRELVQIKRFQDDQQVLHDVNLKRLIETRQSWPLIHGDEIIFRKIESELTNAVFVEGAVRLSGEDSPDLPKAQSSSP